MGPMIHVGLRTDNWRPLSVGRQAACQNQRRMDEEGHCSKAGRGRRPAPSEVIL